MPCKPIFKTRPGQPASATSKLLPPPRMNNGRFREREKDSASCTSVALVASTKYLAGPPILKVVSGASGMFSCSNTNNFHYTHRHSGTHPLCGYLRSEERRVGKEC